MSTDQTQAPEAESPADEFKPPYMAFATFWNFIEELASHPLPPQIDRSLMHSKSGTDQANLLAALRTFRLIGPQFEVTEFLAQLAAPEVEERKAYLKVLVTSNYGAAMTVSVNNGTHQQLVEVFREDYKVTGADTLRKSVTFFLHAARMADIELSPHFPNTRPGQGGPGRGKPRKRKNKNDGEGAGGDAGPENHGEGVLPPAHQISVKLSAGGTMTLSVSVDPITLRGEDRNFFYDIVDKLADYQAKSSTETTTSVSADGEAAG